MTEWTEAVAPRGAYIGWGDHAGQHVTGRVVDYNPIAGTDFAGNACPQLAIELTEPAASFNKSGERSDFPAGEMVVLNCGQVSLKRNVRAVPDLGPGFLIKVTLDGFAKTANGTVKEFKVAYVRGQAPAPAPAPQSAPPFLSGPPVAQRPF